MRDQIMEHIKQGIEEQIEQGNVVCQAEDCDSRSLSAEIWENENGDLQGGAVCLNCGTQMPVEISGAGDISDAADDLDDAIDDFGN